MRNCFFARRRHGHDGVPPVKNGTSDLKKVVAFGEVASSRELEARCARWLDVGDGRSICRRR